MRGLYFLTISIFQGVILTSEAFPEVRISEYLMNGSSESILTGKDFLAEKVKVEGITKNGNEYTLTEEVAMFILVCQADYPISWKFPNPKEFENWSGEVLSYRVTQGIPGGWDNPKTQHFQAFAIFREVHFSSASITCEKIEKNPYFKKTIHISRGGETQEKPGSEVSFPRKWNISENATFEMKKDEYGGSNLFCCSGVQGEQPFVALTVCNSVTQCDFLKKITYSKFEEDIGSGKFKKEQELEMGWSKRNCSSVFRAGNGAAMVGFCRGKNVEVLDAEYFSLIKAATFEELTEIADKTKTWDRQLTTYETTPKAWNATMKEKAMLTIMVPGKKEQMVIPSDYHLEVFVGRNMSGRLLKEGKEESPAYVKEMGDIFPGEKTHFACIYSKMWYGLGAQIRLVWKNGTKSTLPTESRRMNVFFYTKMKDYHQGEGLFGLFSKGMDADKEMDKVECYLPLWNESKWDKIELKVMVYEKKNTTQKQS